MDVVVGHRVTVTDDGAAREPGFYVLLLSREDFDDLGEFEFIGVPGDKDVPPMAIAVNMHDPDHEGWMERMVRVMDQTLNRVQEGR